MPELPAEVVRRIIGERSGAHSGAHSGDDSGALPSALRQAVFGGRPGHPVLIGREHWAPLIAWLDTTAEQDSGARGYLVANGVTEVECGDLFHGDDIDEPTKRSGPRQSRHPR
jgi:CTP:molybdopterin cytidylyltransferase MocA